MGKKQQNYGMEYLVGVIQKLSMAKNVDEVIEITRHAARELIGSDGATFVLKDDDLCYYVDEDAIGPLWKGKKFPMRSCISGWAMIHHESVIVEDIFQDPRIPIDAYRSTFVRSLVVVPIRKENPIGAIGSYWAENYKATALEIDLLEALANSASIAFENIKLYNELKKANSALESALKIRDEFMSITAHELRTPLSSIKLQLQMVDRRLNEKDKSKKSAKDSLGISLQQVDRLASLVEQLLDISRIQLGKIKLEKTKINMTELVRKTIILFSPLFEAADTHLLSDLEENLLIDCDGMKIEQVLINLLSNVLKHAPGSDARVSLYRKENEGIVFEVKDDGEGISFEIQKRLFQRYERGDAPRYVSGFGLGLFITKNLIEAHGGTINVTSEPSLGAQFTVFLPYEAALTGPS